MEYVIINNIKSEKYLEDVIIDKKGGYPIKKWSNNIDKAIHFLSKDQAKSIMAMLSVNTSYTLIIEEIGKQPFTIVKYFKALSDKRKISLTFVNPDTGKEWPARIICDNRYNSKNNAGQETPLVVLVNEPQDEGGMTGQCFREKIWETTSNGEAYTPSKGSVQSLYINYIS